IFLFFYFFIGQDEKDTQAQHKTELNTQLSIQIMKFYYASFLPLIIKPCNALIASGPLQATTLRFGRSLIFVTDESHRLKPTAPLCMSSEVEIDSPVLNDRSDDTSKSSFDSFDYSAHWYPVCWARDVPFNQPIRVTLFDVDYVLAKTNQPHGDSELEVFYAMLDSCPHKKVSLSEGRITDCGTPDKKYFQCSYHGWTFDGNDGKCVEIPQTLIAKIPQSGVKSRTNKRKREDATAVAVTEVQGMVWLQPFLTPLEALAATEEGKIFPPHRIPEIDLPGYRTTIAVRDFPIDWTVLMENIMDPDHGFFAHSSSNAAYGFDLYAADGKENMMEIEEELMKVPKSEEDLGKGWTITSSVNAVEKLKKYNREVRANQNTQKDIAKLDQKNEPAKKATTTFVAPSLIHMGRRQDDTTARSFVTGFWICPVGAGRSRFMSAAISKAPFSVPRWILHVSLNNFLDQDTFLLCGQHKAVLQKEAEGYMNLGGTSDKECYVNNVRKTTYVYRSPSERMGMRIGQFFDATLSRAPNRKETILARLNNKMYQEPNEMTRQNVLDRYEQHTNICPDSQGTVKNCESIMKFSQAFGLTLVFMKVMLRTAGLGCNTISDGLSVCTIKQACSSLALRLGGYLTGGKRFYLLLTLSFLFYYAASNLRKEFFFKRNEEVHRNDVKLIPKKWSDL
ncbi:hypothetical protein ACHAXS_005014, partial [Conticribra weissflogii]